MAQHMIAAAAKAHCSEGQQDAEAGKGDQREKEDEPGFDLPDLGLELLNLGCLANGAGGVDAFLAIGHVEPGGFRAQAAVADIVEGSFVRVGASLGRVIAIGKGVAGHMPVTPIEGAGPMAARIRWGRAPPQFS